MQKPDSVITIDLFPEILDGLLELLQSLSDDEWQIATICSEWTVKDVTAHLLVGDLGILSRRRDGYDHDQIKSNNWEDLVDQINQHNEAWVQFLRWMSPTVIVDLLRWTGPQVHAYFQTLDPHQPGVPVSWAGEGPAPIWLDIAREYTERWHHQQHIRDAVRKRGLLEPRYLAPVIDTFIRGTPHALRHVDAPQGTAVRISITGPSGGIWFLIRKETCWELNLEGTDVLAAEISLTDELAWRLFTKGIRPEEVLDAVKIQGDEALGLSVLKTVAIIA